MHYGNHPARPTITVGDKAVYSSVGGKVLCVITDTDDQGVTALGSVTARVTSRTAAYPAGTVITYSPLHFSHREE